MKLHLHLLAAGMLLSVSACAGLGHGSFLGGPVPVKEGHFGNWEVMTFSPHRNALLCYAQSRPVSSDGAVARQSQPYLMVTRRESGKIEISTSPGYALPDKNAVSISVGGKSYRLRGKGSVAWTHSDWEDRQFLQDFQNVQTIIVTGVARGNATSVDSYTSSGFAKALERIKQLCP